MSDLNGGSVQKLLTEDSGEYSTEDLEFIAGHEGVSYINRTLLEMASRVIEVTDQTKLDLVKKVIGTYFVDGHAVFPPPSLVKSGGIIDPTYEEELTEEELTGIEAIALGLNAGLHSGETRPSLFDDPNRVTRLVEFVEVIGSKAQDMADLHHSEATA